ncbi:LRAT-like domain [Plasmopara halstedii]|uniref:LRAT-like domain n=1 Tax=Plasmopara halstedii TaxID=4781 RepID=A0A0P1AL04_PLAHL|nr:LRAT-like domain [Plasmopara halstedii]CEG41343.1 LRAT-like domain [Plasmopara halstedii]|eukprot:XP_024577712.1 LRAT-like domain [Plasmopara halstedii]
MNTCEVQDVASLRLADHICIWDASRWPFRYTHHGVVFATGKSTDEISIAHVWSRKTGLRESQADSKFQLTSLTEFLNGRSLSDMRRVQYNSSLVAEASSSLGEVHRTHADAPPVVLARCRFLLGLGQGHFSILSLNCEHVALWCTTGVGWSKQLLSWTETKVPFLTSSAKAFQELEHLRSELQDIRDAAMEKNKKLQDLAGKRVYLRLKGAGKFAKRFGKELYLVQDDPSEKDWAFRQRPTALRLAVRVQAYNCVRVEFEDFANPGDVLYASSSGLRLTRRRAMQFKRWFQFELGWDGDLQSLRHRRWFIDAQCSVTEITSGDMEDYRPSSLTTRVRANSAPEMESLTDVFVFDVFGLWFMINQVTNGVLKKLQKTNSSKIAIKCYAFSAEQALTRSTHLMAT